MAMTCLSKLREKLPVAFSLSDFFENATVAQQAALVSRRQNAPDRSIGSPLTGRSSAVDDQISQERSTEMPRRRPIARRPPRSPYPLSPGQRKDLVHPESWHRSCRIYNESEAVRLRGELDIGAIQRALDAIVAQHEVLRTTIQRTEEGERARVQRKLAT